MHTVTAAPRIMHQDKQSSRVRPLVSIIIVTYNGRSYLDNCLQSVLATSGDNCEIILVDNQSTDGSADYVIASYPQIKVILNQNNGYGGGNNLAARFAMGKFLIFLNPDTIVTPGWLDPLIAPLISNTRVGLTTPKIAMMNDPQRLNTAGNEVHLTGLTLCRGMGEPAVSANETAVVSAVSGAAFAIKQSLFVQLGGFDADFFLYMEDTDLSMRATLAGFICLYVPQSVVFHDYALRFGPQKTFYQELNRYLMLLKIWRWRTLLMLLPALLLAELITWAFVLLRDRPQFMNKLAAYAAVWRRWPAILNKRKDVQNSRCVRDRELLKKVSYQLAYEQTGQGLAANLAHLLFDPAFGFLYLVTRHIVWW